MAFNLTSPITGSAQTGFTSPTYTIVNDVAPTQTSKQVVVTALGGTQAGVTVNTVSDPFTLCLFRPQSFRVPGTPNPTTGIISNIANNVWKILTRKGGLPAVNQPFYPISVETKITVPAGVETYNSAEVRAALSAHIGALNQQSAGLGDSIVTGVI